MSESEKNIRYGVYVQNTCKDTYELYISALIRFRKLCEEFKSSSIRIIQIEGETTPKGKFVWTPKRVLKFRPAFAFLTKKEGSTK